MDIAPFQTRADADWRLLQIKVFIKTLQEGVGISINTTVSLLYWKSLHWLDWICILKKGPDLRYGAHTRCCFICCTLKVLLKIWTVLMTKGSTFHLKYSLFLWWLWYQIIYVSSSLLWYRCVGTSINVFNFLLCKWMFCFVFSAILSRCYCCCL